MLQNTPQKKKHDETSTCPVAMVSQWPVLQALEGAATRSMSPPRISADGRPSPDRCLEMGWVWNSQVM